MRRALSALLLLASLAACALAAEAVLRALGVAPSAARASPHFREGAESAWAEPDATLGWRNRAGTARSVEAGHARMHFWSGGRRATRPSSQAVSARRPLLLWTGGSFVQGYGIADAETVAWRLQACFPAARVENLGTGGYGAIQARLSLAEAARTAPDLARPRFVLYGLLAAHRERDAATAGWLRSLTNAHGERVEPPRGRIVDGALAVEPFRAVPPWPAERGSALVTLVHDAALVFAARGRGADAARITRLAVDGFARDAAARGARFAAVWLDWTNRRSADDEALVASLRPDGVEVLDCGVPLEPGEPLRRTGPEGGHPSGWVNARWAECVAAWLRATGEPAFEGGPTACDRPRPPPD